MPSSPIFSYVGPFTPPLSLEAEGFVAKNGDLFEELYVLFSWLPIFSVPMLTLFVCFCRRSIGNFMFHITLPPSLGFRKMGFRLLRGPIFFPAMRFWGSWFRTSIRRPT